MHNPPQVSDYLDTAEHGERDRIANTGVYLVSQLEELAAREGQERLVSPVCGDKRNRYLANQRRIQAMAAHPSNGSK